MNSAKAATAPTPSPHSKTWRWFEQVMESLGSWLVGLIALAGVLAGRPVTAPAADYSAPIHDVGGSFVREWLVLGPIPTKDIEFDFLAEAGGEANVRPKEGDTVTTKDGTRLTWTRVRTTSHLVNLEKVFGIQDRSVAYAERQLSPTKDGMIQSLLPMPAFSETVHTDTNGSSAS